MLNMSRTTTPIVLVPEERATLDAWTRGRNLPCRTVPRSKNITMAADGVLSQEIAKALSVSSPTVQLWRERFLALRLAGLGKDAPRPGSKPKVSANPHLVKTFRLSREKHFVEKLQDVLGLYLNPPRSFSKSALDIQCLLRYT